MSERTFLLTNDSSVRDPIVDLIVDALARRRPLSRRRGRLSTPSSVVLRMLVLKHLNRWSFDQCEREVRGSLLYREFCRIGGERVPDAKTLLRLASFIDAARLRALLERLVQLARARRVVPGGGGGSSRHDGRRDPHLLSPRLLSWRMGSG
jgi:transposase, IS5 family